MGLPCALLGMGRGDEGSYQVEGVWDGVSHGVCGEVWQVPCGELSEGVLLRGRGRVEIPAGLGADTVGGREVSAHVPRPRRVNGGRDR